MVGLWRTALRQLANQRISTDSGAFLFNQESHNDFLDAFLLLASPLPPKGCGPGLRTWFNYASGTPRP